MRRTKIVAFVSLLLSGHAHAAPRLLNELKGKKLAVICVQSDRRTNRRFENHMATHFTQQGYAAVGAETLFPKRIGYTVETLARTLHEAQVGAIAQVSFRGRVSGDGVPDAFDVRYLFLPEPDHRYSDIKPAILDGALRKLILELKEEIR